MKAIFTERGHLPGQTKGGHAKGRAKRKAREEQWLRPLVVMALAIRESDPAPKWQKPQTLAKEVVRQVVKDPRLCEQLFGTPKLDTAKDTEDLSGEKGWVIRVLRDELSPRNSSLVGGVVPHVASAPLYAQHDDLMWRLWIELRKLWHMGVITRQPRKRVRRRT